MTVGTLVRRGVRTAVRWWWQSVRPSGGVVAPSTGPARPAHVAGRPPSPTERWTPSTAPTGPWAAIDTRATPQWPRRGSLVMVAAWGAVVAVRVRRGLEALRED